MKLILAIILIVCSNISFAQKTKILFIGNSYTYTYNLPEMLKLLALSAGDTILHDSSTPGGYTFQAHCSNTTTLSKINQENWNYVVLQEQSQLPSFPENQVETDVYPFARKLDSLIKANDSCSKTIFFMTWGRKFGDASNCASWPPVCTFEGMNQLLRERYLEMGVQNSSEVAPVGVAWHHSRTANENIDLWSGDYSHPSIYGTYLTACVFYATLFRKPSLGINYYSSLDSTTATFLQAVADSVVLDSSWVWGIGNYDISSHFSWNETINGIQFTNSSLHADSYYWDFGDGTSSTEENPLHLYSQTGDFIVKLKALNNCEEILYVDTIQNTIVGLENNYNSKIRIYPNPAHEYIIVENVEGSLISNIQLFNSLGVKLSDNYLPLNEDRVVVPVYQLQKGLYHLSISHVSGIKRISFIKD